MDEYLIIVWIACVHTPLLLFFLFVFWILNYNFYLREGAFVRRLYGDILAIIQRTNHREVSVSMTSLLHNLPVIFLFFQIYFESSSRNKTLKAGSWYVIKLKPCVIPTKQRTWTDVLHLAWAKMNPSPKFGNSHCVATVNPVTLREDPLDPYCAFFENSFWLTTGFVFN